MAELYITVSKKLYMDEKLTLIDKYVYSAIKSYAINKLTATPSITTLLSKLNYMNRNNLNNSIDTLETEGYLKRVRITIVKDNTPRTYCNYELLDEIKDDNYFRIPIKIFDSSLSNNERMTLLSIIILTGHSYFKGNTCSVASLVEYTGHARKFIGLQLKSLEGKGLISREKIKGELKMKIKSLDSILNGDNTPEVKSFTVKTIKDEQASKMIVENEIYDYYLCLTKNTKKESYKSETLQAIKEILKTISVEALKQTIIKYHIETSGWTPEFKKVPHNFFGHISIYKPEYPPKYLEYLDEDEPVVKKFTKRELFERSLARERLSRKELREEGEILEESDEQWESRMNEKLNSIKE